MKLDTARSGSVWLLILVFVAGVIVQGPAMAAPAGMVTTQQLMQDVQMSSQREVINGFLGREDVQAQLSARGVDVADAQARVAALGSAELATLAAQIDELPAGEGLLETTLFLLVIFMLLDIAGVTDIFPGI